MTVQTKRRISQTLDPWNGALAAVLRGARVGELRVLMPDGSAYRFAGDIPGPVASITVRDSSVSRRLVLGGDIALAETYIDGLWDTPDLATVLAFGLANISAGWMARTPFLLRPFYRLWHALHDNDDSGGSKRNIAYHYDLGNEFYKLWLDETMTYSSAMFEDAEGTPTPQELVSAQRRKWDRMLDLIQPGSGDHLLEIGCGWGGFAIHAAKEAGCRITGLTLSEEQAELARMRVAEEGLEGQIDIRLLDYREVPGTFSKIASIEMFEAVGEKWWPVFFQRIHDLLEPGGAAGVQVITIAEDRFEDYRRKPDFIQRYIFPGGMLPSPVRFRRVAERAGLTVGEPTFFGRDYGRTLEVWSRRFESAVPQVHALGFDDRFVRMWSYYLAYCRTGFDHESIDVMQVRLES